jgi:hypothetical protein
MTGESARVHARSAPQGIAFESEYVACRHGDGLLVVEEREVSPRSAPRAYQPRPTSLRASLLPNRSYEAPALRLALTNPDPPSAT